MGVTFTQEQSEALINAHNLESQSNYAKGRILRNVFSEQQTRMLMEKGYVGKLQYSCTGEKYWALNRNLADSRLMAELRYSPEYPRYPQAETSTMYCRIRGYLPKKDVIDFSKIKHPMRNTLTNEQLTTIVEIAELRTIENLADRSVIAYILPEYKNVKPISGQKMMGQQIYEGVPKAGGKPGYFSIDWGELQKTDITFTDPRTGIKSTVTETLPWHKDIQTPINPNNVNDGFIFGQHEKVPFNLPELFDFDVISN